MTPDHSEDPLEVLLSQPYVEDRGFTERVMSALPPPRRQRARGRILLGFALSAAVAVLLGPARAAGLELFSGADALPALYTLGGAILVFVATALSTVLREVEG